VVSPSDTVTPTLVTTLRDSVRSHATTSERCGRYRRARERHSRADAEARRKIVRKRTVKDGHWHGIDFVLRFDISDPQQPLTGTRVQRQRE
jgi:hypothetical protein